MTEQGDNQDPREEDPNAENTNGGGDSDFEKTWVPSETPTVDGMSSDDDAPDENEIDRTWVPASAPTQDGLNLDGDGSVPPDQTAVASEMQEDNDEDVNFESTVVAPVGDSGPEDQAGQSGVFDATVVAPVGAPPPEEEGSIFERTAVAPDREDVEQQTVIADPSVPIDKTLIVEMDSHFQESGTAVSDTIVNDAGGHDFSKTVGMRGLSEEELEQYESERSGKSTAVVEGGSNYPNSTQIWSKTSGAGLDETLKIRSGQVSGDSHITSESTDDKADYQIVEKLAEGGMGTIYVASQTSLDREIAIKTLKPLKPREQKTYQSQGRLGQVAKQRREMFLSEALVTANLVHPHIIPIHDLCETDDAAPFYVMKRVRGIPWDEKITEMTQEENLEVLHKICDAMAYAHHNGVINRDLKPENIMLGEFGEVLVLDWGLAIPSSVSDRQRFASPSAAFGAGTPAYMSPELWAGPADAIGTWSDIYLLGAILFEVVAGFAPHAFPDPDPDAGASALWVIIDNVVRENTIRETDVAGELLDIALRAMAADPQERYSSVLEFQEAIRNYEHHEESRRLADRAAETLHDSNSDQNGYEPFQKAAALYEESCNVWTENSDARNSLRETRLAYARMAQEKGDYDLGLQIAALEQGESFTSLSSKLKQSKTVRNALKYATVLAVLVIVIVGAYSYQQYQEIEAANGTIGELNNTLVETNQKIEDAELLVDEAVSKAEVAKSDAARATSDAEKATRDAETKVAMAKQQVSDAENRVMDAEQEAQEKVKEAAVKVADAKKLQEKVEAELTAKEKELLQEGMKLKTAQADLEKSKTELKQSKKEVADSRAELKKSVADLEKSETDLKASVAEVERSKKLVEDLEKQRVRGDYVVRNAAIASLIRNSDYTTALTRVNALLDAVRTEPDFQLLSEDDRNEYMQELEARQNQLRRLTRNVGSPIQSQAVSDSGRILVWGDSEGRITVWKTEPGQTLPENPFRELKVEGHVSQVHITSDEKTLLAAAGRTLHVWNLSTNTHSAVDHHTADVTAICLQSDVVISGDTAGQIYGWDLVSREILWSVRISAAIRDFALMPEANILLYAGSRGDTSSDVLAYQLSENNRDRPQRLGQLRFPRGQSQPPRKIQVSPDERILVLSNSRNGSLLVLQRRTEDSLSNRDRFPFEHVVDSGTQSAPRMHLRPVNDIQFTPNSEHVVTASDDRSVGVWRVTDGAQLIAVKRMEGHGARVNSASFLSNDGSLVISAGADRLCRFWRPENYDQNRRALERSFGLEDLHAPQQGKSLPQQQPRDGTPNETVSQVTESHQYLLTALPNPADEEPDYQILNAEQQRQRGALPTLQISPDGQFVVTGAADGTAVLWEAKTGKAVAGVKAKRRSAIDFEEGHDFNVSRLQFVPPDGRFMLTTGYDGNLCLWNADPDESDRGKEELQITGLGLVNAVGLSPDGQLLVTSAADSMTLPAGSALVRRFADLKADSDPTPIAELSGLHRAEVSSIAVSSDGLIATGGRDGRVGIWDQDGNLIAKGQSHAKNTFVSFIQWIDNRTLLTAGLDGRLQKLTWEDSSDESARLKVAFSFEHERVPIERITLSPDRKQFATISVRTDRKANSVGYELELWAIDLETRIREIQPAVVRGSSRSSAAVVAAIDWSPDGRQFAAVVNGHLQLFETQTWRVRRVLAAPQLGISDAVFGTHRGENGNAVQTIATFNGTAAHLWNLSDNSHIADFRPLYVVKALAYSAAAGSHLLLTGDRSIRIFDADPQSPGFRRTLTKISNPHQGLITSLSVVSAPAGTNIPMHFVSTGNDGSALLWEWNDDEQSVHLVRRLRMPGESLVASSFSANGERLLLTSRDGNAWVYGLKDDAPELSINVNSDAELQLNAASVSPNGRHVALVGQLTESGESIGWVYDVTGETPVLHCRIRGHEAGGINAVAFLPRTSHIATGGADGDVLLWNWHAKRPAGRALEAYEAFQFLIDQKSKAHDAAVTALSVSTDGHLASASADGTAIFWKNPFQK